MYFDNTDVINLLEDPYFISDIIIRILHLHEVIFYQLYREKLTWVDNQVGQPHLCCETISKHADKLVLVVETHGNRLRRSTSAYLLLLFDYLVKHLRLKQLIYR